MSAAPSPKDHVEAYRLGRPPNAVKASPAGNVASGVPALG